MEEKNRWEIQKMNVVNYWKFANETFEFKKGKLFFVGSNGSGKSNLTQLFPFILDGITKGRLDATGNKEKREMSYYFKPRDEHGEIINGVNGEYGYICVEFKKRYTEQYLTVCIGQKYIVNSTPPLKFNAFILKDGRRVGKDFELFRREENKIIPYEFNELEKLLELKEENIFNDKSSYIEAINKELFGFSDVQELKNLCDIIAKMRNSQYTGKTKVSEIKDNIMSFLPTLDDEKFEDLSNYFQELEESKEILKEFQDDKELISALVKSYNIYNKTVLYNKYKEFLKKEAEYKEAYDFYNKIYNKSEKLEKDYKNLLLNIEDMNKRIILYNNKINVLREAKEIKDKKEFENKLRVIKEEIESFNKEIKKYNIDLGVKTSEINKIVNKITNIEQNKIKNKAERGNIYKELNEKNDTIKFAGHLSHTEYLSMQNFIDKIQAKLLLSKTEVMDYKKDILECARLLKDVEDIKRQYNELESKVEEAKRKIQSLNLEIEKLENKKETEKMEIINQYYDISNQNKFLKISEDSLKEIEKKISLYDKFTYEEQEYIENIKEHFYTKKWEEFKNKIGDLSLNLKEINKEIKINTDELNLLKSQKQIIPDRTKEEVLCRKELESKGIKYISLYEGIDFRNNLDTKETILLENQLINSGLLDSLVIPYSQQEKAKEVLKIYPCLMLSPALKKNTRFDKFVLENIDDEFKNVITDFLSSISTDETDKDSQYVINSNGYFRNGALEGYSIVTNQESAIYLGLQRRKEEQKRKIENKEKEILHLETTRVELEQEKKILENNIEKLREENKKFPKFKKIVDIISSINNQEEILKKYDKDFKEYKNDYDNIKIKFEELLSLKVKKCSKYLFEENSEVYFTIYNEIEKYTQSLYKMINNISEFVNMKGEQNNLENSKTGIETDIKNINIRLKELEHIIYGKNEKKKEIESLISDTELKKKLNEISEYENNLEMLKNERENKIGEKGKFEANLENIKAEKVRAEDILKNKEEIKKIFRSYLVTEINEKITYFDKEESIGYKVNSVSELKDIFIKWEEDKNDLKASLINIFNKTQNLAVETSVKLKRWKLDQKIDPIEDTEYSDNILNNRFKIYIELDNEGKDLLYNKINLIDSKIKSTNLLIEKKVGDILKMFISNDIGINLIKMIRETSEIIKNSSNQMEQMNTPVKVSMELELKENERKIREILQRSLSGNEELMFPFRNELKEYILNKIEKLKEIADEKNETFSYKQALKEIFDYRQWFNLKIYHQKHGAKRAEVTDKTIFSGGEKAMIIYLPMLSAINFKYSKARNDAFKLLVLDEAFSVSDNDSIRSTMNLIKDLDFDFVLNSPEMECLVPNIQFSIYTLKTFKNTGKVGISYSMWNGEKRIRGYFSNQEIEELSK